MVVVFECLDWPEVIRRYDGSGTLFYIDPPYFGVEDSYGRNLFSRDDFARMADQLAGIAGAFVLSLNDTPETRSLFARFRIEEAKVTYTVSSGGSTPARELIISNREPAPRLL